MSADKWEVCPKCKAKAAPENKRNLPATYREDYEIRMDSDGFFIVEYSGYCETCKFTYSFVHREIVVKE